VKLRRAQLLLLFVPFFCPTRDAGTTTMRNFLTRTSRHEFR